MKIQQLMQREPFPDIFIKTMTGFFQEKYSQQFTLSWFDKHPPKSINNQEQVWYCQPVLNAVFSQSASPAVLREIQAGYLNTPIVTRKCSQWLYVKTIMNRVTASWFSKGGFVVSPGIPGDRNLLIMGGNNTIKMIDVNSSRMWEILKAGFDQGILQRKREVYQKLTSASPAVLSTAANGTWIEQEYLRGLPLNRLRSEKQRKLALDKAIGILELWQEQTKKPILAAEYAGELGRSIQNLLAQSYLLSPEEKQQFTKWVSQVVEQLLSVFTPKQINLTLVYGHGDFQPGNILVNGEQIWLLDWENAALRQKDYDLLVLLLASRFPKGLAWRIEMLLNGSYTLSGEKEVLANFVLRLKKESHLKYILAIFLLEDLLWYLTENNNPFFKLQSGGWLLFKQEVRAAMSLLLAGVDGKA